MAAAVGSLVVAGFAAYTVWYVLGRYQQTLIAVSTVAEPAIRIPVAAHELPMGRTIQPEDLVEVETRAAYVAPTAMIDAHRIVGRVVRERVLPGEVVREERLAPAGSGNGLDAIISAGMRAQSINLSGASQVSGFLLPGNRVDVVITLTDALTGELSETKTLLEAVRVLAVDDRHHESLQRGIKLKPQVTLELPPAEAEKLTWTLRHGFVHLVLRSDVDFSNNETAGADTQLLLGGTSDSKRMTLAEYREQGGGGNAVVQIIRAGETTTEPVGPVITR